METIIQLSTEEYDHLATCEEKCKEPYQFPLVEWKLDGPVVLDFGHTKMPSKEDCLLAITGYYTEYPDEAAFHGKSTLCQYMTTVSGTVSSKRTIHKYEFYVSWADGWLINSNNRKEKDSEQSKSKAR